MEKIKKRRSPLKDKLSPLTGVLLFFLIIYALTVFILLGFVLITSLKDPVNYHHNLSLPKNIYLNYLDIFDGNILYIMGKNRTRYSFGQMFLLSMWYALTSGFVKTLVPCLTAYACARFKYKFSEIVYAIVIIVMAIPIVGAQPSEFRVVYKLGLYDNIWFIWLLKANFLGMYFLVFHDFFKNLPGAYVEAAKIDGANNFQILFKIALPLAKNVFLTVLLIETITFWNDYQTPLIYLRSYPTLSNLMYKAILESSQPGLNQIPQKAAAAVTILTPTLLIFLIFQKRLLSNLNIGGIKG